MRFCLTLLGIVVSTASVVALLLASHLATDHALTQFKSLGTDILVMTIQSSHTQHFSQKESAMLSQSMSTIQLAAPYTLLFDSLSFDGVKYQGQVFGVTPAFADVAKLIIVRGRLISDLDGADYYCVMGWSLAQQIQSQGIDPLGQQLLVGHTYFTVMGILKKWQPNVFIYADINDGILIPLSTSYVLSAQADIHHIIFRLIAQSNMPVVQQHIQQKMQVLLPGVAVSFRNPLQIIDMVSKQRRTFSWLLSSIAAISLVVSGIGVMNMMLVSVLEKRRDIGIRLTIGAREKDIVMLFLVEACILTMIGGLLGVVLGVLIAYVVAHMFDWTFVVYVKPLLLGFFISVLVGILSSIYPAFSAARLDPIQSLRIS